MSTIASEETIVLNRPITTPVGCVSVMRSSISREEYIMLWCRLHTIDLSWKYKSSARVQQSIPVVVQLSSLSS